MGDITQVFLAVFVSAVILAVIYASIYYRRHVAFKKELVEIKAGYEAEILEIEHQRKQKGKLWAVRMHSQLRSWSKI